eukprot:2809734-Rhodomonas_salina.2
MRKLFFWAYRTDSTDCLTSAVVAMSGEILPGEHRLTNLVTELHAGPEANFQQSPELCVLIKETNRAPPPKI